MSNNNLKNLLNANNKAVNRGNNALSRLMRQILEDLDIDSPTFYDLINDYVKKENKRLGPEAKSSLKTNIIAALSSSRLSFKFFERFINIIGPEEVEITVKFKWATGHETKHSVVMDVVNINPDEDR